MVNVKADDLEKAIKLTKMRIKHCEMHGMGGNVIQEKEILKKQERRKQLRKERGL